MMWQLLFSAVALVFVLEGILPFLCPDCWRRNMTRLIQQNDYTVRVIGAISMLLGVVMLYIIHWVFG